jgi:hypothetical protein
MLLKKYIIYILIIIILIIIIKQQKEINKLRNIEKFALSIDDKNEVINLIKPVIKEIYNTDMEAVRQLAKMSEDLRAGGIKIPGNLIVTGTITSTGDISSASHSLSGLNTSITATNTALETTNTNLTKTNTALTTANTNLTETLKSYIKYSDNIRITNIGTGNHEGHGNYIGLCGRNGGGCGLVNAVLIDNMIASKFKIIQA